MPCCKVSELGAYVLLADPAGVLDDALVLEDFDGGNCGRTGERMARIRQTSGEGLPAERVGDRGR